MFCYGWLFFTVPNGMSHPATEQRFVGVESRHSYEQQGISSVFNGNRQIA